ncbi:MAG: DNA repair protein RadC [Pseudomonadales bacterium]
MSLVDWPRSERPREKLLKCGAAALSDAELLAIFLRTGTSGLPVVHLARELLSSFGGIRGLLEADEETLTVAKGVGPAKYAQLRAALELTQRYLQAGFERGDAISDPAVTRQYLKGKLRGYGREVFACMYLDNQHRLISYEELFFGTIDGASVHPREVVKRVLKHNAAAVIFAHNHPSGVAEPSQADRRITDRLKSALLLIDVRVLDHMIVGDQEVLSFAERGLL